MVILRAKSITVKQVVFYILCPISVIWILWKFHLLQTLKDIIILDDKENLVALPFLLNVSKNYPIGMMFFYLLSKPHKPLHCIGIGREIHLDTSISAPNQSVHIERNVKGGYGA